MIRILGASLILFATVLFGNKIANSYKERPKQLQELEVTLQMLGSEINYVKSPLPELLPKLAKRFPNSTGQVFYQIYIHITEYQTTVDKALSKAHQDLYNLLALTNEDWEILKSLSFNLGKSDREEQLKYIELSLNHLRTNINKARVEQQKNERMWRYLGVLSGLLIVILLW